MQKQKKCQLTNRGGFLGVECGVEDEFKLNLLKGWGIVKLNLPYLMFFALKFTCITKLRECLSFKSTFDLIRSLLLRTRSQTNGIIPVQGNFSIKSWGVMI